MGQGPVGHVPSQSPRLQAGTSPVPSSKTSPRSPPSSYSTVNAVKSPAMRPSIVMPGGWSSGKGSKRRPLGRSAPRSPLADVVPKGAHVGHDPIRAQEHPRVHSLKDKVGLNRRIHGDEERVMDIAVSVLTDVQDCTLELEPAGDGMLVIYRGMVPKRFNRMSSGPDDVVMAMSNDAVWALCWVC